MVAINRVRFPAKYPKTGWKMQVGDLIRYDNVVKNRLCYGIVKEVRNDMALIVWHKNKPFTFSDIKEEQSWVLLAALTKISDT